jgi:hypothetical protein
VYENWVQCTLEMCDRMVSHSPRENTGTPHLSVEMIYHIVI